MQWHGGTVGTVSGRKDVAGLFAGVVASLPNAHVSIRDIFGQGDMVSGVTWWDYSGAGLIPQGTAATNTTTHARAPHLTEREPTGAFFATTAAPA